MQSQLFSLVHTDGNAATALPPFEDNWEIQVWSNSAAVPAFITQQRTPVLDAAGFLEGSGIELLAASTPVNMLGTIGLVMVAKPGSAATASISLIATKLD